MGRWLHIWIDDFGGRPGEEGVRKPAARSKIVEAEAWRPIPPSVEGKRRVPKRSRDLQLGGPSFFRNASLLGFLRALGKTSAEQKNKKGKVGSSPASQLAQALAPGSLLLPTGQRSQASPDGHKEGPNRAGGSLWSQFLDHFGRS